MSLLARSSSTVSRRQATFLVVPTVTTMSLFPSIFPSGLSRVRVRAIPLSTSALSRRIPNHAPRRTRRFQPTNSEPPPNPGANKPEPPQHDATPFTGTSSSTTSSSSSPSQAIKTRSRLHALLDRTQRWLPSRLRPSFAALRSAPLSHAASFLILHELTALIPLFGLTYLFYAMDWVPTSWVLGPWAAWAEEGLKKYVGYFRKKGWFGFKKQSGGKAGVGQNGLDEGEQVLEGQLREEIERENVGGKKRWMTRFSKRKTDADDANTQVDTTRDTKKMASSAWQKVKKVVTVENTDKGYKLGIQIAAAYTITKLLLIPRLGLSLWLTPSFARGMVSLRRTIWRRT